MSEFVVDLTDVPTKTAKGLTSSDALAYLWGLPVREQIVRCRNCKHFATNIHGSYCKKSISTTSDPNGFCAWSSRKESE